jgi:hypothetical protein
MVDPPRRPPRRRKAHARSSPRAASDPIEQCVVYRVSRFRRHLAKVGFARTNYSCAEPRVGRSRLPSAAALGRKRHTPSHSIRSPSRVSHPRQRRVKSIPPRAGGPERPRMTQQRGSTGKARSSTRPTQPSRLFNVVPARRLPILRQQACQRTQTVRDCPKKSCARR